MAAVITNHHLSWRYSLNGFSRSTKQNLVDAMSYPTDLFVGTAEYYAKYRLPYPSELINDLRVHSRISGNGCLLDLACGTGEVALAMHTCFQKVLAVDQEPEMIEVGQRKAAQLGAENVTWIVGRAEDVEVAPNSLEMITIGSAYHRLDRQLVAQHAREWLLPGRCIVVMGNNIAWQGEKEWQHTTAGIISKWLDKPGAASERIRQPQSRHEEVLKELGFEVEIHRFPTPYVWTLDSLVGLIYSTARASRKALGDEVAQFETDLRSALLDYDPSGLYPEIVDFYYILARR